MKGQRLQLDTTCGLTGLIVVEGFSHYDRVGGDESLVDPANIQQRICEGKDVFGMLPEVRSQLRYAVSNFFSDQFSRHSP